MYILLMKDDYVCTFWKCNYAKVIVVDIFMKPMHFFGCLKFVCFMPMETLAVLWMDDYADSMALTI